MSDEYKKKKKNITGISSHITFIRGVASDINFDLRAETVIIHSTCEMLYVMVRDTCVNLLRGEFILIDPFTPYSIISNPEKDPQTYELLMFRATTDQWGKSSCFFFSNGSMVVNQSDIETNPHAIILSGSGARAGPIETRPQLESIPNGVALSDASQGKKRYKTDNQCNSLHNNKILAYKSNLFCRHFPKIEK